MSHRKRSVQPPQTVPSGPGGRLPDSSDESEAGAIRCQPWSAPGHSASSSTGQIPTLPARSAVRALTSKPCPFEALRVGRAHCAYLLEHARVHNILGPSHEHLRSCPALWGFVKDPAALPLAGDSEQVESVRGSARQDRA